MDPRVRKHAETIAVHSTEVEPDENVVVRGPPAAEDPIVALHELVGEIGASPAASFHSDRGHRAFMMTADPVPSNCPTTYSH